MKLHQDEALFATHQPLLMQFAIISDIHANLQALEAVLADARAHGVDQFICLGDIVGYGPQPSECIKLIQDLKCPTVRGNHDHDVAKNHDLGDLHPDAEASLNWTRQKLTLPEKQWLSSLPYVRRVGRFSIAHATPHRSNLFEYVKGLPEADRYLQEQEASLCFIGHTHVPGIFECVGGVTHEIQTTICALSESSKYLCNVGSVGQPRDLDSRASYVIYDRVSRVIERRRVTYDVTLTQDLLRKENLPHSLAERLVEVA